MRVDDREWRDPAGLNYLHDETSNHSIAVGAWWLIPLVFVVLIAAAVLPS